MNIKRQILLIKVIGLAVITLTVSASWAGDTFFTDCSARLLKVLQANQESQTVILSAPSGESATVAIGDVVGLERVIVWEIRTTVIVLHYESDNAEQVEKILIPVIQIGKGTLSVSE